MAVVSVHRLVGPEAQVGHHEQSNGDRGTLKGQLTNFAGTTCI
jgi:hypothetical protein